MPPQGGSIGCLPELRRAGDLPSQATPLANRGLVHAYRGETSAAVRDLTEAERLHVALGEERAVADIRQNLGFIAARRGDVPTALAWFDQADAWFSEHGMVDPIRLRDRCEALLAAHLVDEARALAEQAVRELERTRIASALPEARLMLAEAALLDGDAATARVAAQQARRAFVRQRRSAYALLARYAELRAARLDSERSPAMLASARRTAAALADTGWAVEALDARLIAGELALGLGRFGVARRELERTGRAHGGPVARRSRVCHARALLRLAAGDRRGAEAALRAGLRALDAYRAALGASDLRAHASGHATELARLGVRLALQDDKPRRVLAWAERWRAGGLHLRPVRPPRDAELADDLAALRAVTAEIDRVALAGRDTAGLLRRQQALESSVRSRARHASGLGLSPAGSPSGVPELARALGGRALVEHVRLDDELYAVTVVAGRCRLHRLGRPEAVATELEYLRFALRRLAAGGAAASRATGRHTLDHAGRRLDELLMGPVRNAIGDRPLVVVPTGALHAVPWGRPPELCGPARDGVALGDDLAPDHLPTGRRPCAGVPGRRPRAPRRPTRGGSAADGLWRCRVPDGRGRDRRRRDRGAGARGSRPPGRPRPLAGRQPVAELPHAQRRAADRVRPGGRQARARLPGPVGLRRRAVGGSRGRRADGARRRAVLARHADPGRGRRTGPRRRDHAGRAHLPRRASDRPPTGGSPGAHDRPHAARPPPEPGRLNPHPYPSRMGRVRVTGSAARHHTGVPAVTSGASGPGIVGRP
jgi:hypothetical protein